MKGELHIPDLPEVPVTLSPLPGPPGGFERRTRLSWRHRLRDSIMGYLPLLLMIALALSTWLIAKNSPGLLVPSAPGPVRHEPDYTVDHFTLQRFDPEGTLKVEIEGDRMQHYADDDTMAVDKIRVVSIDNEGRKMTATANEGRAKGDSSEVWLDGQAQIVSEQAGQLPVQVNGEHLRAQPKLKLVHSDYPVIVQQAGSEFHAQALDYDHNTRVMTLLGAAHAFLLPPAKGVRFGAVPPSGAAATKAPAAKLPAATASRPQR
jgi:lipopolysaccharide export system protein LptC